MAHANPEFALGLMRPERGPVSHQLPAPASLATLRARMRQIGECIRYDIPHSPEEAAAYHAWQRACRHTRDAVAIDRQLQLNHGARGMHGGGRADERVHEPFRRSPVNVQAGRPDKPRRGTLPR